MRRASISGAAGPLVYERERLVEVAETTGDAAEPTPDVEERRRRAFKQCREATERMRAPDTE